MATLITGRVIDRKTNRGVPELRIELCDHAILVDGLYVTSRGRTNVDGFFQLRRPNSSGALFNVEAGQVWSCCDQDCGYQHRGS